MPKSDPYIELDDYTPVADRIELFYSKFPNGRITTKLLPGNDREVVVKAFVYRLAEDRLPAATGLASERIGDGEVNIHSCLENTETSAIGRALANLGFAASRRRPSREEMAKVARSRSVLTIRERKHGEPISSDNPAASYDLIRLIAKCEQKGLSHRRAEIIRNGIRENSALPNERIRRIESILRAWIRRREL